MKPKKSRTKLIKDKLAIIKLETYVGYDTALEVITPEGEEMYIIANLTTGNVDYGYYNYDHAKRVASVCGEVIN